MPDLASIEYWPPTGHRNGPWVDEPEVDAWVKSSRRVCELYGEALQDFSLPNRVGGLRLMAARGASPHVVVSAFAGPGYEGARVEVPACVRDLTPLLRARLVLDATDLVLRELASVRGWPLETVAGVRRRVLESGFHFGWSGRTVSARDRRRAARTRFWLSDGGFGPVRPATTSRQPYGARPPTRCLKKTRRGSPTATSLTSFKPCNAASNSHRHQNYLFPREETTSRGARTYGPGQALACLRQCWPPFDGSRGPRTRSSGARSSRQGGANSS